MIILNSNNYIHVLVRQHVHVYGSLLALLTLLCHQWAVLFTIDISLSVKNIKYPANVACAVAESWARMEALTVRCADWQCLLGTLLPGTWYSA